MKLFYVLKIKKYILRFALIFFIISLLLQFYNPFFFKELALLASIKAKLGYPITFFPNNTLLVLRFLLALIFAFTGGLFGYLLFRFKFRNTGHTIFVTESFRLITGISFLCLIFLLLRSEQFIINPIKLPSYSVNSNFTKFLLTNLRPLFTANIIVDPIQTPKTFTTSVQNPKNSQAQKPNPSQQYNSQKKPQIRQATANEIFTQLNSYRLRNGKRVLIWDPKLANYAQDRANLFASINNTDNHAGFSKDTSQGLYHSVGFDGLAENSGFGAMGDARFIVEEWFGKNTGLNNNQLSVNWTHVGIGVNGQAINFIFGGGVNQNFWAK